FLVYSAWQHAPLPAEFHKAREKEWRFFEWESQKVLEEYTGKIRQTVSKAVSLNKKPHLIDVQPIRSKKQIHASFPSKFSIQDRTNVQTKLTLYGILWLYTKGE
ncbi:TPA: hypothetical protein ACTZ5W_006106, partial [Bacillus cereus]